tara:strand:- start:181 stop:642 length:462 start_codon:yes stop_codon:yes gene_type:complete
MSTAVRYYTNKEDQMNLVNTAFLKAVNGIKNFKAGTSYYSWLKRIAQNTVIDEFRKNKNYKKLFDLYEDSFSSPSVSFSYIEYENESAFLQEMLDTLPPATKLVFNLYAIDGLSSKEIEKKLNIKYETIKWHVKTARRKLKVLLEKQEIDGKI